MLIGSSCLKILCAPLYGSILQVLQLQLRSCLTSLATVPWLLFLVFGCIWYIDFLPFTPFGASCRVVHGISSPQSLSIAWFNFFGCHGVSRRCPSMSIASLRIKCAPQGVAVSGDLVPRPSATDTARTWGSGPGQGINIADYCSPTTARS